MFSFFVFSVDTIYFEGVRVDFYSGGVDNERLNEITEIPDKYFEGLLAIQYFPSSRFDRWGDYLYQAKIIRIYNLAGQETLIHELAHHQQNLNRESFSDMWNHSGNFTKYYDEIQNSIMKKYIFEGPDTYFKGKIVPLSSGRNQILYESDWTRTRLKRKGI